MAPDPEKVPSAPAAAPKSGVELPVELPDDLKAKIDETKSYIESKIEKSGSSERMKFMQCMAEKVLEDPIMFYIDRWKAAKTLPEKEQIGKELMSHLTMIKAIVDMVCPEGVRMRAEHLQRIIDYGKMLSTNPEYKDMRDAVRWVMGMPVEGASSVDSKDAEKAKKTLVAALRKYKTTVDESTQDEKHDPEFAYACTLISALDHDKKMEIIKSFLTEELNLDPSQPFDLSTDPAKAKAAKDLLAKLNKLGAASPMEIEELVGVQNVTDEERYEYSEGWDAKHNLVEFNKHMMGESYGARNDADKAITLTNILLLVGMVAGAATVVANIAVNVKKEGRWRKITEYPELLNPKNSYILLGGLVAGGSGIAMSTGGYNEFLADKDAELQAYTTTDFQADLNASPGFRHFFEDNDHKGLEALSTFVNSFPEDQQKKHPITLQMFKDYLLAKQTEPGYADISEIITSMEQNEHEKDNLEARFARFAKGIHVLNIGGTSAIQSYHNIAEGRKMVIHNT